MFFPFCCELLKTLLQLRTTDLRNGQRKGGQQMRSRGRVPELGEKTGEIYHGGPEKKENFRNEDLANSVSCYPEFKEITEFGN